MNLRDLKDLAESFDPSTIPSSSVRKQMEKAIARQMGLRTSEEYWMMRMKLAAVAIFLTICLATFTMAMLASVQRVHLDDRAFDRIWETFAGSFVTSIIGVVSLAWRRKPKRDD